MNHAQSAKFETKVSQPGINTFWIADKFICCGRFAIYSCYYTFIILFSSFFSFYRISIVLCNVACVCMISCYCETFTYGKYVFCRLVGSVGRAPDRRADTSAVGYIELISMRLSALNKIVQEENAMSLCLSCYFVPWKPSPFLGCSFCLPQNDKERFTYQGWCCGWMWN